MKKAILLLMAFLGCVISEITAQPLQRMNVNSPGVQQLIVQYGDELQLTDGQKSELIALQIDHRKQLQAARGAMKRGDRSNFRRDGNAKWQGSRRRGVKNPGNRGTRAETRIEMRNKFLDILTEEQQELLQTSLIEKVEKEYEFRTFWHEYIVNEAGIESEKAGEILRLLNAQSEARLELARQQIRNPDGITQDRFADLFQQMRNTDRELRKILTVDEYESLRGNLGFGNRFQRHSGRGYRAWNR